MESEDKDVTRILEEWQSVKELLDDLYRSRDFKNTKAWMDKGIELFLQFMVQTNDMPFFKDTIPYDQFEIKPVNLEERLEFIIERPNLYHSYRQLSELMSEQEKHFVKKNIIKKSSKPNG